MKTSDLSPPLGKPGGPCQVIRRIEDQVRQPGLKRELVEDVQQGESLSNAEAAKVYPLSREQGSGLWKQIRITSHAQYRMDLRSVTVDDLRTALGTLSAQLVAWQKAGNPAGDRLLAMIRGDETVEWTDARTKLKIVFHEGEPGVINLVTCFWKGRPDPLPPGGTCKIADRLVIRWLRER